MIYMKVTTSCYGRFWIFDQANQLYRHQMLYRLINDYPKFMTRRWEIPDTMVKSLLMNGIYGRLARKSFRWIPPLWKERITESVHHRFSERLARHVPPDTDIFIGLSSFCLEAVHHAKQQGIVTIVDHGSLHQEVERRLLSEEYDLLGLPMDGRLPPNWIIEKEDREFRESDYVIVLSQAAKRSMVEQGVPEEKIFVNHLGVNLDEFSPGKKEDHVFRVIQCGGIHPRKGVQYLLQAFRELNLPNSELWFIGGGLDTSSLLPVIEKYRADNIFFKGSFPQSQLHKLYRQGSVFVLASIADGFGMVVPQAMACGLPVIVTENVGAADIVTSNQNGYVIPIRSVNALKEKLLFLYENQKISKEMGQYAFESVRVGHTWDDYGDRLVDFLQSIHNKKRSINSNGVFKP